MTAKEVLDLYEKDRGMVFNLYKKCVLRCGLVVLIIAIITLFVIFLQMLDMSFFHMFYGLDIKKCDTFVILFEFSLAYFLVILLYKPLVFLTADEHKLLNLPSSLNIGTLLNNIYTYDNYVVTSDYHLYSNCSGTLILNKVKTKIDYILQIGKVKYSLSEEHYLALKNKRPKVLVLDKRLVGIYDEYTRI